MKKHGKEFSIVEMARIFDVTPSGYYGYSGRGLSRRAVDDASLLEDIKTIFYENNEVYGRYRMYLELKKIGKICSQRRVSRLMKEASLVAKARRRFKVTTKANSDATAAPNKLKQNFKANKPNEKWVSDLTYVWTSASWLYLAVVMDLFSRKIVGMAMGNRITKELVCKAFLQAMLRRGYPVGLLYHSEAANTPALNFRI